MKITNVHIENFRCFEYLDLGLEKFQAIVGENTTGKTSLLEAINLATSLGYVSSKIDEQDFNISDKGDVIIEIKFDRLFISQVPDGYTTQNVPCQSVVLNIKRRDSATPGKALSDCFVVQHHSVPVIYLNFSDIDNGLLPPETTNTEIPTSISKTEKGYQLIRRSTGTPMGLSNLSLSTNNDLVGFPSVFYFNRFRENEAKIGFGSLLSKVNRDLNWRYRKNWSQNETVQKWDSYYKEVIDAVEEKKRRQIIKPLQEKMKEFFGSAYDQLELSLLDIEQPFLKAFFSLRTNSNQIERSSLGSGASILLAYFLLEIISKLAKEEIIFLIDEPELHLHPQLQEKLFWEFKKSDYQIIYTTQSDIFIDISQWRSILRFADPNNTFPIGSEVNVTLENKTISDHLDEIKQWHQHQSIFFREDNQLFFAKKCLLTEGPAEKYGLPILASKLNKGFKEITILSCNGKSKIPYYQLLCKAFGIPYFTLFDLDNDKKNELEEQKKEREKLNKRIQDWSLANNNYSFDGGFEGLLGVRDSEHKGSEVLIRIDNIKKDEIPKKIIEAINEISRFIESSQSCPNYNQDNTDVDTDNENTPFLN